MFNWNDFMNDFPYTNFSDINVSWFLNKFKQIFDEWQGLYTSLQEWKTATDAYNEQWRQEQEQAFQNWENNFQNAIDEWKAQTETDIGTWENDTLANLETWKNTFITEYNALKAQVEQIAIDAENAKNSAEQSAQDAQASADSASATAESLSSSLTQIATNTNDISDLKTQIAQEYSSSATYTINQFCTHDGKYYRCGVNINTPEVWNASKWVETSVSEILEAMTQKTKNLWTFGDKSFTRYTIVPLFIPAGTYAISALITSEAEGSTSRISFDDEDNATISHVTITRGTTVRGKNVITLDRDCHRVWLFSGTSSSTSTGYAATWKDIQIEAYYTATDYVPPISAKDTVLRDVVEKLSNTPGGINNMLPNSVDIDAIAFAETGYNLFNSGDNKIKVGLINIYGDVIESSSYKTTWYIKVNANTVYYVGGYYKNDNYKNLYRIVEYDKKLTIIKASNYVNNSITTDSNTAFVRFSYSANISTAKVYFGLAEWDGQKAPAYEKRIDKKYLPKDSLEKHFSISGNLNDGDYLKNENTANSIRSNERVMFNSDITTFVSLEIGFAWFSTNYKYNRFLIDNTNLTVYDYSGKTQVTAHGLTIENNIQVLIESNFMRTAKVTIISNGQLFSVSDMKLDRRRVCFPYAQSVGSVLPNAKLTWSCVDFDKPVWIFGDSYIASYTDKWVKYAYQYGYTVNCLWDAFPGEDSEESLQSLADLFVIARPKTIVWCLGMNDGSDTDNSTPSTKWITVQESLRTLCKEKEIELVLATIPTVPTINHQAKNANVRASGYRYIDFARAVGATASGVWYDSMLSNDGIHPSDSGAKALFGRVVLDLPEIMIAT